MIDYLIIGSGLAGIAFAETALQNQKKIVVIDNNQNVSSTVAAGLYNPVILKRFTAVWNAQEQLLILDGFYKNLELKLNQTFNFKKPILRKFFSIEEQNNWFVAADKTGLSPFLSTKLRTDKFQGIDAPYDYGEVKQTGYVDVVSLLNLYKVYLQDQNFLQTEIFDHDALVLHNEFIQYKDIKAKHIIFAEGFGMHQNPFFKDLPLDGAKGELLIIKAPELSLDVIVNTSVFILPLGNQLFKVGATYNWEDKTNTPTQAGKEELIDRIKEIITCDFEIISHFAGVRPTVKDRKPLVGTHQQYSNVHILNGLGTRGVMLGPAMAKALFENIEQDIPLPPEINIKRFVKKK
ncbi:FAD-binding oxidoreductase [Flavobacterium sp.]|uniref:NAD(P)/FAD-dependent oxidoreductase n=1 Tax=Flavobacterium sp. TaxID=239 RepID=UPI00286ABC86|nr:FAD-binding oxidoreductase [Flavobacterium sp.]